ncbi:HEXXH motif-containing putative peptide modification protein [Streptomyces sp. WI03-4A]|uniref:aKG-HExxH-type peptide beta-hydroxylase n=1 Tax=Streptomyces sp. WI03-4A TaxID=3028706 RepID=UPI0029B130F7|nr:HEXXH motif-containing putative peptide modification protein [Streptomyces sp. WI03-4A]MDX2598349.1 HEXXH motif-containing putative peptide modification protein [Streptomyces sp. WI03-4A]
MTSVTVPGLLTELAGTRPSPDGTAALRAVLHARRLLTLKALLLRYERQRAELRPETCARFERDWSLLEAAERTDADAVREVVDYPLTGAWLTEALAAPPGPPFERHLAHLGGLAAAAAVRAGCRRGVTRVDPPHSLHLPGLGTLGGPADGPPGTAAPAYRDASAAWTPLAPLAGGAVLDDLNPYRVPASGIGPGALRAAERGRVDHERWSGLWGAAHALLAAAHPERAAETRATVRALVPLERPGLTAGPPISATRRAAPGAVLAEPPRDAGALADLLVHETHHTKLAALGEAVPLLRPGADTLHRVAWRPDPRPVSGVLQGAYAHLALLDLWWRARAGPAVPPGWRLHAHSRFEAHRDEVAEALSILRDSSELTSAGREFVRGMDRHLVRLGTLTRHPA